MTTQTRVNPRQTSQSNKCVAFYAVLSMFFALVAGKIAINITNDNINNDTINIKNQLDSRTTVVGGAGSGYVNSTQNGNSNGGGGGGSGTDELANTTTLCSLDFEIISVNTTEEKSIIVGQPIVLQLKGTFTTNLPQEQAGLRRSAYSQFAIEYTPDIEPESSSYVYTNVTCQDSNVLTEDDLWAFSSCELTSYNQFAINVTIVPQEAGEIQDAVTAYAYPGDACGNFEAVQSNSLTLVVEEPPESFRNRKAQFRRTQFRKASKHKDEL